MLSRSHYGVSHSRHALFILGLTRDHRKWRDGNIPDRGAQGGLGVDNGWTVEECNEIRDGDERCKKTVRKLISAVLIMMVKKILPNFRQMAKSARRITGGTLLMF